MAAAKWPPIYQTGLLPRKDLEVELFLHLPCNRLVRKTESHMKPLFGLDTTIIDDGNHLRRICQLTDIFDQRYLIIFRKQTVCRFNRRRGTLAG